MVMKNLPLYNNETVTITTALTNVKTTTITITMGELLVQGL